MPEIIDMITTSLEGISRDELRAFWSALHKMENKLALMANGSAIID